MIEPPDPELHASDRVRDVPRILAALRMAVHQALLQHKRLGNSVVAWRNGRVEWIPPEEIPDDMPADDAVE